MRPALFLALPLAACAGQQSAFAPMGPEASRIADLSWLLILGAAAIFLLTMALLLLAFRGGARLRRRLGSQGAILAGGAVLPVLLLSALLIHTLGLTDALGGRGADTLRIEVTGRQFWWEVRYPDHDVVTANEIHIPVGRPVELLFTSTDVLHSLWIPALHGKRDMIPGHLNRLRVTADRPGVMRGQCAEFCGAQHTRMALFAVATTEEGFAAWIARQRTPVPAPGDPLLAQGRRAFASAGCGACHALRGTEWTGRAGPDLTRIGARLSLAAGTLPNHRETLSAWIADPQAIKPASAMPGFGAVLAPEDIQALAAWLESLR
jgi:cytochrome c oxidase subunit 2